MPIAGFLCLQGAARAFELALLLGCGVLKARPQHLTAPYKRAHREPICCQYPHKNIALTFLLSSPISSNRIPFGSRRLLQSSTTRLAASLPEDVCLPISLRLQHAVSRARPSFKSRCQVLCVRTVRPPTWSDVPVSSCQCITDEIRVKLQQPRTAAAPCKASVDDHSR